MTASIPVEADTKERLDRLKREDETWSEFLDRLAAEVETTDVSRGKGHGRRSWPATPSSGPARASSDRYVLERVFEGAGQRADMDRTRARLLALVVALAAGGVGYALSSDPILALTLVEVYGVSALGYFVAVAQVAAARDGGSEMEPPVDGGATHTS